MSKISKTAEATIQKLMSTYARYTMPELAKVTGISISKVHFILKKLLYARTIFTSWIPYLLSDDQKRARVTYAKNILNISPNFDKNKLANVVTGVETCVQFYESQEKVGSKIWATKSTKRPCTARTMSFQKLM